MNGDKAQIRSLVFHIKIETTVECINVPSVGERWFKKMSIKSLDQNEFLEEKEQNLD